MTLELQLGVTLQTCLIFILADDWHKEIENVWSSSICL
jgi:hypothetical protein